MTDRDTFSPVPMAALRALAGVSLGMALLLPPSLHAQSLRLSSQVKPSLRVAQQGVTLTADFIVALVNSEPVTNNEVRQRLLRVEQQYTQRGVALPPREVLAPQVLEQLVTERAQLQRAAELGIRVDEAALAQAEMTIAAQNQLDLEEFRRRVVADGMDINRFRNELRNQLLLQRLQEREIEASVTVTEADIDDFLREQNSGDLGKLELSLAHVLILVPEDASPARVAELQARAQMVADRARAGGDFAALAREFSGAAERVNGGAFGWRTADRLPSLFVDATRALPAGGIAGPLRSAAGFHVLKVLEKRQGGLPDASLIQTRSRHILLRPSAQLSQADAVARLNQYREQIASGKATFEELAKEHSQDGSARSGGDLGWVSPGQFVPEFEQAMNGLRPGEMSQPLVSRFGVHLIRVEERRQAALSQRDQREMARGLVREKKAGDALRNWIQDVRGRAFVEYRDAPRL